MRGAMPLLLLAVALSASSATGEPSPPYTAFVTGTNVYVRSGPGMNYYPTDKLQKGDQVEVYRHDPGGWYAIRPPRNSFSWVSARHVEKAADGLGRASDDQAVVRVGSRLSNVRDTVQVRLDPGEPVEILESFNAGGQTWYKIAPPSGEFRWMYGRYLNTTPADPRPSNQQPEALASSPPVPPTSITATTTPPPPVPPTSITATSPPPPPVPPTSISATSPPQTTAPPVSTSAASPPPAEPANVAAAPPASSPVASPHRDEWQSRGQPRPEGQPLQDRNSVPTPVSPRPWQADRPALPGRQPSEGDQRPLGAAQTAPSTPTGDQVARLERQLSIIVAEDPTTWQFEELRRVASRLLVDASTAPERGRLRQVLGKISRFEEIQQRRVQMGLAPALANRGPAATPGGPPAPATRRLAANPSHPSSWLSRGSNQLPGAPANASPFDGVGTLRPVVSRRRNTPGYALVDNAGQVVSFVTPGPGVNLQPYLGRKIGIRGNRGYIPELRQTNVMARRITALDPGLVR